MHRIIYKRHCSICLINWIFILYLNLKSIMLSFINLIRLMKSIFYLINYKLESWYKLKITCSTSFYQIFKRELDYTDWLTRRILISFFFFFFSILLMRKLKLISSLLYDRWRVFYLNLTFKQLKFEEPLNAKLNNHYITTKYFYFSSRLLNILSPILSLKENVL